MISIVFDKFIAALHDYEYASWMLEALDERTCITLLNSLINPVSDLRRHIKIYERVDNKGFGFTSQEVMNSVLEYAQVPVTIQSYAKAQSYAKMTGKTSGPKNTRRARRHDTVAVTVLSNTDKFPGLKANNDGTFSLYGKFTCSRHSFWRRFILGNYLSFLGCVQV